jgi:hypothetical protein
MEKRASVATLTGRSPAPYRDLTLWLYRNGWYAFVGLTAFAVLAFWPRYLAQPLGKDIRFHVHAAALGTWCALLIGQSFLIRAGQRAWHRRLGRWSYVVGPAVSLSILILNHHRSQGGDIDVFRLWLFTSNIGDAALFVVCWALAMSTRHAPIVHSRYMVCTAVTFIPPIFDRLFSRYALTPLTESVLPTVGGRPFTILPSFVMVFVALAALAWWDRRTIRRSTVFAKMFVLFAVFYAAPLILATLPWWHRVIVWYLSMPLS